MGIITRIRIRNNNIIKKLSKVILKLFLFGIAENEDKNHRIRTYEIITLTLDNHDVDDTGHCRIH